MNILFSLPRQHPNQAGWYQALAGAGHRVKYVVSYSLPTNERGDLPEPDIITNTAPPFLYTFLLRAYTWCTGKEIQKPYLLWPDRGSLEKAMENFSPDLIIIREALTPLGLVTQSLARRHGITTVHYSQAPLQKQDGLLLRLLRALTIIPDFRLSPTLDPKRATPKQDKVFYVPLFVPAAVTDRVEKNEEVTRLLFVGKYIRRKKQLLLIEAFHELSKTHQVELTMVGSTAFADENYRREIIKKIEDLQLEKYITLQSDIDPLKMGDLYRKHDVFVLPSIDEPFSISPLEAMAFGLPVIVTDTNGCQFHIKNGENGYVVKSDDLKTLVQSLKQIIDCGNLATLKQGALNYAQNSNNEENFLTHFAAMTKAIASGKN